MLAGDSGSNIPGSKKDIARHGDHLKPGLRVLFNGQDEFEVEGTLEADAKGQWLGRPDYGTLRYL